VGIVIAGVGCLRGFPPPLVDPLFVLTFSRLEGCHNHHLCSPFECLALLGYPLLKDLKDLSPTFGGLLPPIPTMVVMNVATLSHGVIPTPILAIHLAFPPDKAIMG
jgi:hypothetical protein